MNQYIAISLISKIKNETSNYIEKELNKKGIEGLVVSHGNILYQLYSSSEKLTMKDISERIDRSKSTVTQLVEKLIKNGYVKKEKNEKDKRITNIVLTEKAWEIKPYFDKISEDVIERFFSGFSELEKEMFLKMLDKIILNF